MAGTLPSTPQSSDSGEGNPIVPFEKGGPLLVSADGCWPKVGRAKSNPNPIVAKPKVRKKRGSGKSATVATPERLDSVPEEPFPATPDAESSSCPSGRAARLKELAADHLAHRHLGHAFHPYNCECRCCLGTCHICQQTDSPADELRCDECTIALDPD